MMGVEKKKDKNQKNGSDGSDFSDGVSNDAILVEGDGKEIKPNSKSRVQKIKQKVFIIDRKSHAKQLKMAMRHFKRRNRQLLRAKKDFKA